MFRFLSRLFVALAALLALRLLFATARRVNQAGASRRAEPPPTGARSGASKAPRTPRIDASLAEDVPFVEVGAEREPARRD